MKFSPQHDQMDCGPACLKMIANHHGKDYPIEYLRKNSYLTKEGVSLQGIKLAAQDIGFKTFPTKVSLELLMEKKELLPCILHWNQNHFVVLQKIYRSKFSKKRYFLIADPAHGFIKVQYESFKSNWLSNNTEGVVLYLNPKQSFFEKDPPIEPPFPLKRLLSYLKPYKRQLSLMFLLLMIGSLINIVLPFLTQRLIDDGVNTKDMSVINIILLAQLSLITGTIITEIFRNWLMLYVGTKVSIQIISDFLKKLLSLPINFFETKMIGDFNQRIQDNQRVENFLTSQSLITIFSVISLSTFLIVLLYYDSFILLIYILLTTLSIIWSLVWLKKRRILDYYKFQHKSENQDSLYEIINGVAELKLNNLESYKRNNWKKIQKRLLQINIRLLKVDQFQLSGFNLINQAKNIFVTYFAASYVIEEKMTLGTLLAISFIIGQLNAPISQLINFFRSLQDAKLSLSRLQEVQNHPEEDGKELDVIPTSKNNKKGIKIENLSFQYGGPKSSYALKQIDLFIPEGKTTAIVGASGSGKTTLLKLLLKFYRPTHGKIYYNQVDINKISSFVLRGKSGVVMQEGYIFSDTIERNIATSELNISHNRLTKAIKTANIEGFINDLPLKLKTKIGASGNGISGGQKQRLLIARAVYKNPNYLFLDEATSALDAENEKIIHSNLNNFFKKKTAIIIAHRLSTVKNADQIVVLENGCIVEIGNHEELVLNRAKYFDLIKNQLELGN
ncbi:peptidase domain-containing ABC transporter [Zunongwangia sp. HGR-M22]|uniref:peptidase domain-containing ABC transporter n=1 Tax=Zunongwangia sp. HGR-M22 TaxID=3015168 RepID=UPI0022DE9395|nr:peptidase domain-containing ABC transporter [Zunongwangia sp. HGR-M22]WBL25750.1 peptidase domain-containing ABC transporter [Zunongwangia sp. HGR-M22]